MPLKHLGAARRPPRRPVRRRFAWRSVDGFVRPRTGQSWGCLLPTVSTEAFGLALAAFARDEGIGPDRRAVLALDRAGWHLARHLAVPDGVHFAFLLPYSLELPPTERLWPLVDEPVANRTVADLDALEAVLARRCRTLEADRRTLKAHTRYRRWPRERRLWRHQ